MIEFLKSLKNEHVINIKELQKSPSRHLRGVTRILRGSKTLGYFLDTEAFEDVVEDLEAAASASYRASIAQARHERSKPIDLDQVKRRYGL